QPLLLGQLRWIASLRWVAGLAVIIGGLIEHQFLHWYPTSGWWIVLIGLSILACNVVFHLLLRPAPRPSSRILPYALAWTQILLDLVSLTALVALTGGYQSPLRGFFVFHMVFASLLLPRAMAFTAALAAIVLVEGTLSTVTGRAPTAIERGLGLGWDV